MHRDKLSASWDRTRGHLARARLELSPGDDNTLAAYQEMLDHNELELAMDTLDELGQRLPVSTAFWSALADAADEMKLLAKAEAYRRLPSGS
jgi:hypothetical protein